MGQQANLNRGAKLPLFNLHICGRGNKAGCGGAQCFCLGNAFRLVKLTDRQPQPQAQFNRVLAKGGKQGAISTMEAVKLVEWQC